MIVGTVRERKIEEFRVALTPASVGDLVHAGHTVLVETIAGAGSHYADDQYAAAGAQVVSTMEEVYARAELICEVKEPQPSEYALMREGQVVFTYLHLAAEPVAARAIIDAKCIAIGYETVRLASGALPLLAPMSEVAGRLAVEEGARFLERPGPGRGILLGGIPGVPPAHVVVIGSGNVGRNAVRIAVGMGARVTVVSNSIDQLRDLDQQYAGRVETALSSGGVIAALVPTADLLIGAVLVEGERAPVVVTRAMVRTMQPGSVIVDVAVDQGGCVETTHPTNHDDPIYVEEGVVHYAVPNMPGSVPRTASHILSTLTLPYALAIANLGVNEAIRLDPALAHGVNVYRGHVTHEAVARALALPHVPLAEAMAGTG
ncbi:MAG: alanine dehydrogenase [Dehalococcoidia bacterium]|nr:alanine dehydrogenase [Dehalococcoidia bacterium]